MRFHIGLSFSWRNIKKYIIGFLIGLMAFFGFNYLSDHKDILSFGFIQTYALEEEIEPIPDEIEDSYYYYSYLNAENEETIEHKPIFNKVYWFDDNSNSYGVLSNIYILLFLYCTSRLLLQCLRIVKNTKF